MIATPTPDNINSDPLDSHCAEALGSKSSAQILELLSEISCLAVRLRQVGNSSPGISRDLPGAEHAVLSIIHRFGPLTVPQIARERITSRQNIQIVIDRLQVAGRVELTVNPTHKRSFLVRLTDKGKMALNAADCGRNGLLMEIEASLPSGEIAVATALLRKVHGLISGISTDEGSAQIVAVATDAPASARPVQDSDSAVTLGPEEFPINLL